MRIYCLLAAIFTLVSGLWADVLFQDTFTGASGTLIQNHIPDYRASDSYVWESVQPAYQSVIRSGNLDTYEGNAMISGLNETDVEIIVSVYHNANTDNNRGAWIGYRLSDEYHEFNYNTGYFVKIAPDWSTTTADIALYYSTGGYGSSIAIASVNISDVTPDWDVLHEITIVVSGDTHKIAWEGTQVLETTDTHVQSAGNVALGGRAQKAYYDNLTVNSIPEPLTAALVAVGGFIIFSKKQIK